MPQDDKALFARLCRNQVDFVIVGGVCCILHGAPLVTYDLDVCIRLRAIQDKTKTGDSGRTQSF
jgi:hypothetical protein